MKRLLILTFLFLSTLSGCIIDLEMEAPYVEVGRIEEYETEKIISEVWSNGHLVYKEAVYTAWLDIEFINTGGLSARNVWADIILYDGYRVVRTARMDIPNIQGGHALTVSFDTGMDFITDYSDYEVYVHWD